MSDRVKTTMNQNKLPSLESVTSSISTPWNVYIEKILSRPYPWRSLPRKPSEGELALIWYRVYAWKIALHWVIKKQWNKKHKIPTKQSLAKRLEPKGEFLRQILLLCEGCHAKQEAVPTNIPYPNAAHWFYLVFWELIIHEMVSAVLPRKQPEFIDNKQDASPKQSCTYRKSKQDPAHRQKRNQIRAEMREFRQLKTEWLNPIKKDDESMRAIFLLFQAAIKLSEDKHNEFFVSNWEPFLNAWEAQIKEKEKSSWGHVVKEDNRVKVQIGKGKYKRVLSCPLEDIKEFISEAFI